MNPATMKKALSTPPAPQHRSKRLSFFLHNVTRYTKEKIDSEIQRAGMVRKKVYQPAPSEMEIKEVIEKLPFHKHITAWIGNTFNKFRPENRKLGMRGA